MRKATIYVGDVLDGLKCIASESVQCVISSPPYWSLRDYDAAPIIRGGDPACTHEWGPLERGARADLLPLDVSTSAGKHGSPGLSPKLAEAAAKNSSAVQNGGRFCGLCSAWQGQLGLEPSPEAWVAYQVEVFRAVRRVLRKDGVIWVNIGDSYCGPRGFGGAPAGDGVFERRHRRLGSIASKSEKRPAGYKPKDLIGQAWMLAFALRADGWYLRADVVWHKPNPLPESVTDRPVRAHEYLFLLAKEETYYYDAEGAREAAETGSHARHVTDPKREGLAVPPGASRHTGLWKTSSAAAGRNPRDVWQIPTQPFRGAHFATFPEALVEKALRPSISDRGACTRCGAPFERISLVRYFAGVTNGERSRLGARRERSSTTLGWYPTCACDALPRLPRAPREPDEEEATEEDIADYAAAMEAFVAAARPLLDRAEALAVRPCIVLDPYSGAATTGLVAIRRGLEYVGCEINAEYAGMGRARILKEAPLLNDVRLYDAKSAVAPDGAVPLLQVKKRKKRAAVKP